MKRSILLFYTISHLKPVQVWFRLFYVFKRTVLKLSPFKRPLSKPSSPQRLKLRPSLPSPPRFTEEGFCFLNQCTQFSEHIQWNYADYGALWTYNLAYFEYLHQPQMDREQGQALIYDFIEHVPFIKMGLDAYPISLRGINWIKFCTYWGVRDRRINDSLYAQYYKLLHNIEYHVGGNHLLENGLSLLWGAYYFNDQVLFERAAPLISRELNEQILDDGAHYELSPMYHTLILFRLLDTLNLVQHNTFHTIRTDGLRGLLMETCRAMCGWLAAMMYKDRSLPLFNDAALDIAPNPSLVLQYAQRLGVQVSEGSLNESGYRKMAGHAHEVRIDAGPLGPEYQPGHGHCDMLNFELRVDGKALLVDTGTSTYEAGERRLFEKGTGAHNTVMIDGVEQSELWGSFRAARRGHVKILEEHSGYVKASHQNFRKKTQLIREFINSNKDLVLIDTLERPGTHAKAFFHFAPDVEIELYENELVTPEIVVRFTGNTDVRISSYQYAAGFNAVSPARMAAVSFSRELKTEIVIRRNK